jgi:hypothetical protein
MTVAPCFIIPATWRSILRISVNLPPSKNESGVMFRIPITAGGLSEISLPLQLMNSGMQECFTGNKN